MILDYNILNKMIISILILLFSFTLHAQEQPTVGVYSTIDSANKYIEDAAISFRRKDYRSAIEFYEKALEISPVIEIDYFVNLAKSYMELGDYKQAIVATRRGIRFNSVLSWDIYYQQGYAFYRLGEYRNAIISIERALTVSESGYLYNFLGLMYIYTEDYQNAQESFLSAIRYNPTNPTFLCNLAASYEMQRNFSEALNVYQRAEQFDTLNQTQASKEATRIRNYLATRTTLPKEVDDSNIGTMNSSTDESNLGIVENVDNIEPNENSSNTNEVLENTE